VYKTQSAEEDDDATMTYLGIKKGTLQRFTNKQRSTNEQTTLSTTGIHYPRLPRNPDSLTRHWRLTVQAINVIVVYQVKSEVLLSVDISSPHPLIFVGDVVALKVNVLYMYIAEAFY
jgi:hypothetical protein